MFKFLKDISGLAIFSFILAVFSFFIFILDELRFVDFSHEFVCVARPNIAGIAALSGIVALIYIKKTGLKGKWFAILAVIFGLLGFSITCM